jgi:two-component system phosphate regulon sensor histidine kinase PhoR
MLDDLVANLCSNAIRYNKPGGYVRVWVGLRSGRPVVEVADNGIGIPKEAQAKVFERFYRVETSRSRASGGTGLGLAIVKHVAALHSAEVSLQSELGMGTTITVTFPESACIKR